MNAKYGNAQIYMTQPGAYMLRSKDGDGRWMAVVTGMAPFLQLTHCVDMDTGQSVEAFLTSDNYIRVRPDKDEWKSIAVGTIVFMA